MPRRKEPGTPGAQAATPKRKGVPPRLRFEVFKRDGFACVYCGATPPGVVLHADHVDPVAGGGETEIDNLVTACAKCNGGKGSVPLSVAAEVHTRRAAIEREREVAEVNAAYDEWRREKRLAYEALTKTMVADWNECAFRGEWALSPAGTQSIGYFAKHLLYEDMLSAMKAAMAKIPWPAVKNMNWYKKSQAHKDAVEQLDRRFRYFCGVCHNMIKQHAEQARR